MGGGGERERERLRDNGRLFKCRGASVLAEAYVVVWVGGERAIER